MTIHNNSVLPSDELVVRRIVRAIQKAIEEDVPEFCRENHMETMNSIRYVRGDKINDNLRSLVVSDDMMLISFKRHSWDGRILVDNKNYVTYSITTQQNLSAIPKKNRRCPHFLHSILAVENGDLKGQYVQESLFPMDQFGDDVLEDDYTKIVSGVLAPDSGYRHYIVAYEYARSELCDVKLMLLDKSFSTVRELSLNDFIKPDFAQLTAKQSGSAEHTTISANTAKELVTIKSGIRPELIEFDDEKQA